MIVFETTIGYIPKYVKNGNKITPPPSPQIIATIPTIKTREEINKISLIV